MGNDPAVVKPEDQVPKETRSYHLYILSVSLAISVVLLGIFFGVSAQTKKLIQDQQLDHIKAYYELIMLTGMRNGDHGGVFVRKREGTEPDPMLDRFHIETRDGDILVLRKPAVMTRELSEYTEKYGIFSFHISSLRPMDRENLPDDFDKRALLAIGKGAKEFSELEEKDGRTFLRLMKPLQVKELCLDCHAEQGYRMNEVRGGISLKLDVTDTQEKLTAHVTHIVLFTVCALSFLLAIVWYFTRNLFRKIVAARNEIEEMAITDGLTRLFNRRYLEYRLGQEFNRAKRNRTSMSCLIMDIDNFKSINDTHGHGAGDQVLRNVSREIRSGVRDYDIVGRYGGEEFFVILPHTSLGMAKGMAERLRKKIKALRAGDISVTVSIGVTRILPGDTSGDDIVKRADRYLYEAKEDGKDRVKSSDFDQ